MTGRGKAWKDIYRQPLIANLPSVHPMQASASDAEGEFNLA